MKYKKYENQIAIQLFKGEDLISSILEVTKKENVIFGSIQGIGRIDNVTLAHWDKDHYAKKEFKNAYELANITGNIVNKDNLHLHVSMVEDNTFKVIGGHLVNAKVSLIAEIFISLMDEKQMTKEKTGQDILPSWKW